MAYNSGFPMNYGYPQQPQYYQPMQQVSQPQPTQNQMQIQNGGFVSVANEEMVRNYPVAPGNCVTFKIEGQPIVIEKSMGFSQLESPRLDRYRLVREEAPDPAPKEVNYASKKDFDDLAEIVTILNGKIKELEKDRKPAKKTKLIEVEDIDNDAE